MKASAQNSAAGSPLGLPLWTIAAPVFAGTVLLAAGFAYGGIFVALIAVALAGSIFAAVHHAEVIAHRVGEPYGTLVLALFVAALTLRTGRTIILHGVVLL